MTKSRAQYLYKFPGTILNRQFLEAPPNSKYAGTKYLKLKVALTHSPYWNLQVFPEKLTNPNLWSLLQAKPQEILRKQYIFHCKNQRGHYYLVDWEELPKKPLGGKS